MPGRGLAQAAICLEESLGSRMPEESLDWPKQPYAWKSLWAAECLKSLWAAECLEEIEVREKTLQYR